MSPSQLFAPRHMSLCMINEVEGFTLNPFKDFGAGDLCAILRLWFTKMNTAEGRLALIRAAMFMLYVYDSIKADG